MSEKGTKGIDKPQVTSRFEILEFEFSANIVFLGSSVDKSLKQTVI
jgi:hypothetical protein